MSIPETGRRHEVRKGWGAERPTRTYPKRRPEHWKASGGPPPKKPGRGRA